MTIEELRRASVECEDVEEGDVAEFLRSSNPADRLLARTLLTRTAIRRALSTTASLAREQNYTDQGTLNVVQRLSGICDIDEPYIETLKRLGLQAAERGQFDVAMSLMQECENRAISAGQRQDVRSRRAMRYIYDVEIDEALDGLAKQFAPPPGRLSGDEPLRLVLFCSALQDEDGPTVITYKRAILFRAAGFDVEIVSTEMVSSANTRMTKRLEALGFPIYAAQGKSIREKLDWLLEYFRARPANAISFTTSGVDLLGKLIGCIGAAPVQAWDNRGVEPQAGKYDLIYQGISAEQEVRTAWPGRSRYFGSSVAMAEEIDAAVAFPRASLGVPEDAVLLATFGRMEKCAKPEYMAALATILQAAPNAWLVLAGRNAFGAVETMQRYFEGARVFDRVRYLGPRQEDGPELLKTIDVYCETYPWPGGQSLLDAMQAAVPIVAMRRSPDLDLDPTGCGSISSVADELLSGVVDLANAGDVEGYVRIARSYIENRELRLSDGKALRNKAVNACNMRRATFAYGDALRELFAAKMLAVRQPADS